ncbi:MAG: efflux RND transporter periplasmic adaptor subunit [Gemmatimonadales bacterium]
MLRAGARTAGPPEVRVVTADPQPLVNVIEVPGRLEAVRAAEVRARVDGIVRRRLYDEGTDVRAGQALFSIDPREMRAQLSAAQATLARAEATAANAKQDVARYEGLVAERAISHQDYDAAVARSRTAEADVAQARAQVDAERLNLSYTTVTAPIAGRAGRAGRAEVTEGALVSATGATLVTNIEQLDPIYANFSQSSSDLLAIRRDIASGALKVTQVIEQELNGVEGFLYMTSSSQSNGSASITVTFTTGTDIDVAQMDVQARLRSVEPRLPEEVRRQGVRVNKANTGFLMVIALTSQSGATPTLELGNFAAAPDEGGCFRGLPRVPAPAADARLRGVHCAQST